MNPKISIIVPMYGVEKYLDKCIKSIQSQTIHDIEIILIDDGSPDRSGEIAETFAKSDERIRVIHQKNAGLGPARNTGMYVANGEYIGFVDSDDWVENGMFERLYRVAEEHNADIVVGGHCDWRDGKAIRVKKHPLAGRNVTEKSEIDEIRKNLYGRSIDDKETEAFPMSVWIAIYKRSMIVENSLKFDNPIEIKKDVTIKAIAISKNHFNSDVAVFEYKAKTKEIKINLRASKNEEVGITGSSYISDKIIIGEITSIIQNELKKNNITVILDNDSEKVDLTLFLYCRHC